MQGKFFWDSFYFYCFELEMKLEWSQSEHTLTLTCTSPGDTDVFVSPHFVRIACLKTKRSATVDLTGEIQQKILRCRHVGSLFQVTFEKVTPGHWGRLDIVAPGPHVKARRAASIKQGKAWRAKVKADEEAAKREMQAKAAQNALRAHENRVSVIEQRKRAEQTAAVDAVFNGPVSDSPSKENNGEYPMRAPHGFITVNFTPPPSTNAPARAPVVG